MLVIAKAVNKQNHGQISLYLRDNENMISRKNKTRKMRRKTVYKKRFKSEMSKSSNNQLNSDLNIEFEYDNDGFKDLI